MKLKTQKLTDGYSNEGYTPIPFYEKLNSEFKFDLDSAKKVQHHFQVWLLSMVKHQILKHNKGGGKWHK